MLSDDFPLMRLSGHSMGTTWSVHAVPPSPAATGAQVQRTIQTALDTIVAQMSHWEPASLLSQFNRAPTGWYQLPPEFLTVLTCALDIACVTDGAYDPTVGELVSMWGFGAGARRTRPPGARQIATARKRAGWDKLFIEPDYPGVWQPGGVTLDFSAIAKGYGVDTMAAALEHHDMTNYLVELGGELRARGVRPDGTPWRIEIEAPNGGAGLPIVLRDRAIATSGDTRRYFVHQGQRYAHTIDPRTGWPLDKTLASVSVIHNTAMVADALSTALLCMGWDDGLAFARAHRFPALLMRRSHDDDTDIVVEWSEDFFRVAHPDAKDKPA